jgi:hypothetical protein
VLVLCLRSKGHDEIKFNQIQHLRLCFLQLGALPAAGALRGLTVQRAPAQEAS